MRALSSIVISILTFAAIVSAGPEPKGGVEGKITKVVGSATVERDDGKIVAKAPMDVLGGDVIVTAAKAEVTIELDGHIVKVAQNSHFAVDETSGDDSPSTAMLYYGMVYARKPQTPATAKARPLEISTPTAVAGVRGTAFTMAVAPDGDAIFGVEEGEITVETDEGSTVVNQNQEVAVDPDQPALKTQPYDPNSNSIEKWREEKIQRILQNPLPALRRLGGMISILVRRTEVCLENCKRTSDEALRISNKMEEYRKRGQTDFYDKEKASLIPALKAFRMEARMLVRMDNRLASRIRLMNIILDNARAEGASTPPRQLRIIENHIDSFKALDDRAKELHRGRRRMMRVVAPQVRQAAADVQQ